jgi:hypothetical protein
MDILLLKDIEQKNKLDFAEFLGGKNENNTYRNIRTYNSPQKAF